MSRLESSCSDVSGATTEYVTMEIAGQLFGVPIVLVEDVFFPQSITPVPLSPDEVAGILNLRGKIVTAICMRTRLGLPATENLEGAMAIGVAHQNETYGLIIDKIGEVLRLPCEGLEATPSNLDSHWRMIAGGVHKLDGRLMVVLDVTKVLETGLQAAA